MVDVNSFVVRVCKSFGVYVLIGALNGKFLCRVREEYVKEMENENL